MARITTEDCTQFVPNKFELVLLAVRRAREIAGGSPALVPRDNDKPSVLALREIAEEKIDPNTLREEMIDDRRSLKPEPEDRPDDDSMMALFANVVAPQVPIRAAGYLHSSSTKEK